MCLVKIIKQNLKDNNIKGKITYDNFVIDFSKPFVEQELNLCEDLLQINFYYKDFNDKYTLDLGWYPEFNHNGNFIIYLGCF